VGIVELRRAVAQRVDGNRGAVQAVDQVSVRLPRACWKPVTFPGIGDPAEKEFAKKSPKSQPFEGANRVYIYRERSRASKLAQVPTGVAAPRPGTVPAARLLPGR